MSVKVKKVITTVGTSLFTNKTDYKREIWEDLKAISEKPAEEWDDYQRYINGIKENIQRYMNQLSSAEITSLNLIKEKLEKKQENVEMDVYLICTDTVVSRLAAEILEDYYKDNNDGIKICFDPEKDVISDLQVKDARAFKQGIVNLIERFEKIREQNYENMVLNITGGFKALIPFMTILGQIHGIPTYYVFEDSETLIEIPAAPISFNKEIFNKYKDEFWQLEEKMMRQDDLDHQFIVDCESCLYIFDDGEVTLNELGTLLWKKFCSKQPKFNIFYCEDKIWRDIQNKKDIKRILQDKFHLIKVRSNKILQKGDHLVYDDGDSPNRIFLFYYSGKVYIYKVFTDHDRYEQYLNSEKFPDEVKNGIIKRAKKRALKIEKEEKINV